MWLDTSVHKDVTANYEAYLNGEKLSKCRAANEEEGWAEVYELNEKGKYIVDKEANCVKTKKIFGDVKLVKKLFEDRSKRFIRPAKE